MLGRRDEVEGLLGPRTAHHATDVGHGCPAPTPLVLSCEGARMRPKKDLPLLEVFGGGAGRSAGVHSQLHVRVSVIKGSGSLGPDPQFLGSCSASPAPACA
jgi:hypothetical protein